MSTNNRVFEEIVEIKYIDRDVKVFDKVQRCEGITRDTNYEISMDINSEIYPMKKGALYTIILAKSIYESKTTPKNFDYELFANTKSTLMDNFEYVMCGKVFQFSPDKKRDENSEPDTLSISISFGGLLFQISKLKRDDKTGKPKSFEDINLDDTLYLLMKKLAK
mgnify:FL=1